MLPFTPEPLWLSVVALSEYGLNIGIKKQLAKWIKMHSQPVYKNPASYIIINTS
jgi:hypothetical protein